MQQPITERQENGVCAFCGQRGPVERHVGRTSGAADQVPAITPWLCIIPNRWECQRRRLA
jgi:hypothetical protein